MVGGQGELDNGHAQKKSIMCVIMYVILHTDASAYNRSFAIKTQLKARNAPRRGLWVPKLCLYGIRELA